VIKSVRQANFVAFRSQGRGKRGNVGGGGGGMKKNGEGQAENGSIKGRRTAAKGESKYPKAL